MSGLTLLRPRTLSEALDALGDEDSVVIAGGQSIVLLMNTGLLAPERLVSIAALPELRGVEVGDDHLDVGALCTHQQLVDHPVLRDRLPVAARMFEGVGNVRVRNSGTVGGNLVHADPAQDPPVLLAALGASAIVVGTGGEREVAAEDVAAGPLWSSLDDDELLTRVRIPWLGPDDHAAYIKFLPGTFDDYATVSVAAKLTIVEGRVEAARLTAGAVGATVAVLDDAAESLVGRDPTDPDALDELASRVRDAVSPFADRRGSADYKRQMAGVVARRAVQACVANGPARGQEDEVSA